MEEGPVSCIRLNTGLRSGALGWDRLASGRTDTGNRSLRPSGTPGPRLTAEKTPEQKGVKGPLHRRCSGVCHPYAPVMTAGRRAEDVYCRFSGKLPAINFHFHFQSEDLYSLPLNLALKPRTTVLSGSFSTVTVHKTHSSRAPDVVLPGGVQGPDQLLMFYCHSLYFKTASTQENSVCVQRK